jgi:hypothetical protein
MGDNVPGKPRVIQSYLGGFQQYRQIMERAEDTRYEGYRLIARGADNARDRAGAPSREAAVA